MKSDRLLANYLFILLPLLLMASPSYASMGDISICFPFFLLLALLMAGMMAQGKSPLVGFDISISKPPAEIRSTSYHFKSYTSGGFDTVASKRNKAGGGTHATRGFGKVVDAAGTAVGKITSKLTGEKYGSKLAKQGVGWAKTMSQRGFWYTVTGSQRTQKVVRYLATGVSKIPIVRPTWRGWRKRPVGAKMVHIGESAAKTGMLGGGQMAEPERDRKIKEGTVRSLKDMMVFSLLTVSADQLTKNKNELKKLEDKNKKSKVDPSQKLTKDEQRQVKRLRGEVRKASAMQNKLNELKRLSDKEKAFKEKKGEKLTNAEKSRLKSLRTELRKVGKGFGKLSKDERNAKALQSRIKENEKGILGDRHRERQIEAEVKALDAVAGIKGRATMMAAPFTFLLGAAGTGVTYGAKAAARKRKEGRLKKEIDKESGKLRNELKKGGINPDKPMTDKEFNDFKRDLDRLRKKPPADNAGKKRLDLLEKQYTYLQLNSPDFNRELNRLRKGTKNEAEIERLRLLDTKEKYLQLKNRPNMFSAIFNPYGKSKGELARDYRKAWGASFTSAAMDATYITWGRMMKDDIQGWRLQRSVKKESKGLELLDDIANSSKQLKETATVGEKYKIMKQLDEKFIELEKTMRAEKLLPIRNFSRFRKKLLSKDSQEVTSAINDLAKTRKELREVYKTRDNMNTIRNDLQKQRDNLKKIEENLKKERRNPNELLSKEDIARLAQLRNLFSLNSREKKELDLLSAKENMAELKDRINSGENEIKHLAEKIRGKSTKQLEAQLSEKTENVNQILFGATTLGRIDTLSGGTLNLSERTKADAARIQKQMDDTNEKFNKMIEERNEERRALRTEFEGINKKLAELGKDKKQNAGEIKMKEARKKEIEKRFGTIEEEKQMIEDIKTRYGGNVRNAHWIKRRIFKRKEFKGLIEQLKEIRSEGNVPEIYGYGISKRVKGLSTIIGKQQAKKIYTGYTQTAEQQRQASVSTGMLQDFYKEAVESGTWSARLLSSSFRPFAATQWMRHVESVVENVIGPMEQALRKEEMKLVRLRRLLKYEEETQSKAKKLKQFLHVAGGKTTSMTLYGKRNKLENEYNDLKNLPQMTAKEIQDKGIDLKMTDAERRQKMTETLRQIRDVDSQIADVRKEISQTKRNIDKIMNSFLYQDALLLMRQREDLSKRTDEESKKTVSQIKKLDKKTDKYFREKLKLEEKMREVESQNDIYSNEYSELKDKLRHPDVRTEALKQTIEDTDNKLKELRVKRQIAFAAQYLGDVTKYDEEIKNYERYRKAKIDERDTLMQFMTSPAYTKLMNQAIEMESNGKAYISEYRKSFLESKELDASIAKNEFKTKELRTELANRARKLTREMKEASAFTEIKVGGEEILRKRDIISAERRNEESSYRDLINPKDKETRAPRTPNIYAVNIIRQNHIDQIEQQMKQEAEPFEKRIRDLEKDVNSYQIKMEQALAAGNNAQATRLETSIESIDKQIQREVRDRDSRIADLKKELDKENDNKRVGDLVSYYSKHKEEYKEDLQQTYQNLKRQWKNLETVSLAEFLHKTMEETGDPRVGGETGLNRELYEVNTLLDVADNKEMQKDLGVLVSKELREYLERKYKYVSSKLYLNNLEMAGIIPVGTAIEYGKKFEELDKQSGQLISNASLEAEELKLKIKFTNNELDHAKKVGWESETKRLQNRINEFNSRLKQIADKADLAVKAEFVGIDVEKLNNRITELKTERETASPIRANELTVKLEHLEGLRPHAEQYDSFRKKEDEIVETTKMHQLSMLLQRRRFLDDSLSLVPDKERVNFMADDTRGKLEYFERSYDKNSNFWRNAEYWAGYAEDRESKRILRAYKDRLSAQRQKVRDISSEMEKIQQKYDYGMGKMSKEDENELKQLFKDRAEEQKLLNERYKEWTDFRNQYRATFEPERRAESLARPGSEKKVDKYFREVEDDIENRFGVGRLAALDSLGKPFSKAVSAIAKFGYKHGSQALFVASLAAPFTIPVVGAMGAVGIQATAGGIWGTKAIMRKHEEWMEYGSPFSADDRIARTAWESGIYASHLTGRGSGAYPKSYDLAWKSQVMGTEYITRGLWVNEAGKLQSYNQGIWIPNETVPWFIRPVKGAIDSTGAALSIFQRRLSMRILNPGAYPSLPQFIMENPSYVGEVQKKIAYQYFQMFGSNEPFPAPKQAWEMSESRVVSLSMPYQEQAAYIRIMREYSPDPLRREIRQPPAFRTSGLAPMDAAIRRDVMRRNDELQMQKMSIAGALRRGHQDQLYSTGAK